ncbi:MAG TPA: dTDP-4-dehydrorhamnose 3,5-epimerase [Solirubrobacterales bacterium]|nr:dTDP-4-dehydrorhamnose 3,5-epimerase [Solirubrobacterales bacterium]
MRFQKLDTSIDGLVLLQPKVITDDRGFFFETYRRNEYSDLGIDAEFVQDNHSRSVRGTIRALHFQLTPGQAKLIRVARGSIYDVAVDLRRDSPAYGQFEAFELSDENAHQIFIPVGFAHGFCVTSEEADVAYKVSSYYDQATERGIAWDDPDIAIPWPAQEALVSDRDRNNPRLTEIAGELPW